jgi:geranylgeranyl diphosphate synthase type II
VDIETYLRDRKKRIDSGLATFLPLERDYPPRLCEAIRYGVMGGGKRIRPILAMAAFDAGGGKGDAILPFACALEFIHAYSLIHDDLPAMDDDDFRRGRPTVHRVFGEAVAILAGDALLAEAFRTMSRGALDHGITPDVAVEIVHDVAVAVGWGGLVGGQTVDIESEGRDIDLQTLEYIHRHKTGALILASLRTGARLSEISSEKFEAITRYGEKVGLAFQIADDVLDVVGDSATLGKQVGSDEAKKKATYPVLVGVEESRRLAGNLVDEAVSCLTVFEERGEPLRQIASYVIRRSS